MELISNAQINNKYQNWRRRERICRMVIELGYLIFDFIFPSITYLILYCEIRKWLIETDFGDDTIEIPNQCKVD